MTHYAHFNRTFLAPAERRAMPARRIQHEMKVRVVRRAAEDGHSLEHLQKLGRFKTRQGLNMFLKNHGISCSTQ